MFTRLAAINSDASNHATEPASITESARGARPKGRSLVKLMELDKLTDWLVKLKAEEGRAGELSSPLVSDDTCDNFYSALGRDAMVSVLRLSCSRGLHQTPLFVVSVPVIY